MRLIFLILTIFGLILINGCAKKNYEEIVDQVPEIVSGTFLRSIEVEGETMSQFITRD